MYCVCYLDPKLPGTGYWVTGNLFFWGDMDALCIFIPEQGVPLQDRLLCFEEHHLSCSLTKGRHKPGLEAGTTRRQRSPKCEGSRLQSGYSARQAFCKGEGCASRRFYPMSEGWHQRFLCLILIAHALPGWSDRNWNPWASSTSETQQSAETTVLGPLNLLQVLLYRAAWVWGGQGCLSVSMGRFQSFPSRQTSTWARADPGDMMSKSWFCCSGISWTSAVLEAFCHGSSVRALPPPELCVSNKDQRCPGSSSATEAQSGRYPHPGFAFPTRTELSSSLWDVHSGNRSPCTGWAPDKEHRLLTKVHKTWIMIHGVLAVLTFCPITSVFVRVKSFRKFVDNITVTLPWFCFSSSK